MNENDLESKVDREGGKRAIKKKDSSKLRVILFIIAIILLVGSIVSIGTGFDKYSNYYNSEYSVSLNKNAYVGGDAYNYIINAGYFTAFVTLGGTMLITSAICATTAIKLKKLESIFLK